MRLHHLQGREKKGYTTFGCVWEKGEATSLDFRLLDNTGKELPVQSKVMAWWLDKSIKWSAHTANVEQMTEEVELTYEKVSKEDLVFGRNDMRRSCLCEKGIQIQETVEDYCVDTGKLKLTIDKAQGCFLARNLICNQKVIASSVYPVFVWETRQENGYNRSFECKEFKGEILSVELEEQGALQTVFCFKGNHIPAEKNKAKMPFVIRMYLWADSEDIRLQHTFLYDGEEDRDYLKGMGIRFDMNMSSKKYDRHIQFGTDKNHFHEAAVMLASNSPKLAPEIFEKQLAGEFVEYDKGSLVEQVAPDIPLWNDYSICQDSAYHYAIRKRTEDGCCELTCLEGKHGQGTMAVNSQYGGLLLGIKDFWQKYPSGLEVKGLGEAKTTATIWFYAPQSESFDFRHYSKKSYPRTCYEGFDYVGATAYGIGVTSEARMKVLNSFVKEEEMEAFARLVQKPAVYIGEPQYYHAKKAFGYWSLVSKETEVECWLEEQMDKAFSFYKQEVDARDWYGLFDYGDVMHTYDAIRHVWRYDFGGMAWQNTELVPTYWLWLYFLRTGREDVFTMIEAMSRHCSEVDTYHFGPLKGLGSRHNVRHWGCSCKEPRIAMAGHHRFLCYLTGDSRLLDIFEEVKDSDYTMIERQKARNIDNPNYKPGARSGPDWSTFTSNWMTWYEMTLEEWYRERMETGIRDIMETPYGLASGPDYGYDVDNAHLIYQGEVENTPNQHLQICMGAPQIWFELADMLEDDSLNLLMERLGAFYYLDKEEKARITEGKIKDRPFDWPRFATAVSAFSAMRRQDEKLAKQTWKILLESLWQDSGKDGHRMQEYAKGAQGESYYEIPWITTNTTAQWCLNVMMCLEFIREYLPKSMDELEKIMESKGERI